MAEKKSQEQVLFPEIEIGEYKIKPWSFGMLFRLSILLDGVIEKAEVKGIIEEIDKTGGMLTPIIIAKLFSICGLEVQEIISMTLDIPIEEVDKLDMSTGIKIAYTIFQQNKDCIKNALTPLLTTDDEKK